MLTNEQQVELHAALTPVWSETAWCADYVLPMGVGSERHDLMSQETHAGRWIGFRQPVLRVYYDAPADGSSGWFAPSIVDDSSVSSGGECV